MPAPEPLPVAPEGYRIQSRLGSGRTAHVYLARHGRFGAVALKLPRELVASRPELRRMFENEVMITLKLGGERVVRGLDGKPTGAGAYLALELCPGGTLDQLLLEKGRLPMRDAVRLVEDVAEGLAFTHDAKVLHRDVKPANVFLTEQGRAKLGDFGTGSFMTDSSDERVGTAFYMAPELFEGQPSSVASDVYSLGVLAFEVLTGERPFRGESYEALMHEHLAGLLRDPRTVRADLGDPLSRVVRTAMARSPERRYESVSAFLNALREATPQDRPPPQPRAPKPGRSGRHATRKEPANDVQDEDSASSTGTSWWRRLFGGADDAGS